jgi:hypothetical protein
MSSQFGILFKLTTPTTVTSKEKMMGIKKIVSAANNSAGLMGVNRS